MKKIWSPTLDNAIEHTDDVPLSWTCCNLQSLNPDRKLTAFISHYNIYSDLIECILVLEMAPSHQFCCYPLLNFNVPIVSILLSWKGGDHWLGWHNNYQASSFLALPIASCSTHSLRSGRCITLQNSAFPQACSHKKTQKADDAHPAFSVRKGGSVDTDIIQTSQNIRKDRMLKSAIGKLKYCPSSPQTLWTLTLNTEVIFMLLN